MAGQYKDVPLFGGAAHCNVPSVWIDASLLRDIPSHQEVYVHKEGGESVIIEILQHEESVSDEAAGEFFFKDLADADAAVSWQLDSASSVQPCSFLGAPGTRIDVSGVQVKGKSGPHAVAAPVGVFMTVFRSPQFQSDILVTCHFDNPTDESHNRTVAQTIADSLQFTDAALFD